MIIARTPDIDLNGSYTVGQVCKVLCIHRNTLRRYTEIGVIKCYRSKQSGRKFYSGREILRFWKYKL